MNFSTRWLDRCNGHLWHGLLKTMPSNERHSNLSNSSRFNIIGQSAVNQSVVDQRNQRVDTQLNTVYDQRDQRRQHIENQFLFHGDPATFFELINRTHVGVVFQVRVIGAWLALSIVTATILGLSSASGGVPISFFEFTGAVFGLFIYFTIYGFIGLLIQGIFHYQWRFRSIRNSWLVWCFYPLLSIVGIVLWFVGIMLRFGPRLFEHWFRF